jgi:hypothetical protein
VTVVLLGPQRTPTVGRVVRSLALAGPVVTITAGWQEREPEDTELNAQLGSPGINLGLLRRWFDVQERDPVYAAAARRRRQLLDELQDLYLVRLDHALQAAYEVQRRTAHDELRDAALVEAIEAVRQLDAAHLARIGELLAEFHDAYPPDARPALAEHRAAVSGLMRNAGALVVTGGHVGVLAEVLHLFNVAPSLPSHVIAWSAGAMALTDRLVLFHDRSLQGPGHPEIYGSGLGVVPGVVPLPHARARLILDDPVRMAVFARRFAPARCVLLESGDRVDIEGGDRLLGSARVLDGDGRVTALEAA